MITLYDLLEACALCTMIGVLIGMGISSWTERLALRRVGDKR